MIDIQKVYIIIPVHNRRDLTRKCLLCLQQQTLAGFHVVIIDDGCIDGTSEMLRDHFPWVEVLRGDGSLWWTASVNRGVRYALKKKAEYILTLNDDTEPLSDYMEMMVAQAEIVPNAIIGSCAMTTEGKTYQDAGTRISWIKAKNIRLLDLISESQRSGLVRTTHFHGRGCWIPTFVFDRVGYYDEKTFPQLAADDDLTLRSAQNGVEVFVNFNAKILAQEESSLQFREKFSWRNYREHLFGRRGGANLRTFVIMAFRHCPRRYLPSYLVIGFFRRALGFPVKTIWRPGK